MFGITKQIVKLFWSHSQRNPISISIIWLIILILLLNVYQQTVVKLQEALCTSVIFRTNPGHPEWWSRMSLYGNASSWFYLKLSEMYLIELYGPRNFDALVYFSWKLQNKGYLMAQTPLLIFILQHCFVCCRMRMLVFGKGWNHYYYAPSAMRRSLIPENCPAGISFALSAWIYWMVREHVYTQRTY